MTSPTRPLLVLVLVAGCNCEALLATKRLEKLGEPSAADTAQPTPAPPPKPLIRTPPELRRDVALPLAPAAPASTPPAPTPAGSNAEASSTAPTQPQPFEADPSRAFRMVKLPPNFSRGLTNRPLPVGAPPPPGNEVKKHR